MSYETNRLSREVYSRAERFLPWNAERLVYRLRVVPHWIDEARFWYRVDTREGYEFVLVDSAKGLRVPAFDHVRLAAAISRATGTPYEHSRLPFDAIEFEQDGAAITFGIGDTRWRCELDTFTCTALGRREEFPEGSQSPDGRWVAFARDSNLFIRSMETGEVFALTTDGEPEYAYATPVPSPLPAAGIKGNDFPPALPGLWAPNNRWFFSYRIDRRRAGKYHLVQSVPLDGSLRPVLHSYTYPLPGDEEVPIAELILFDVQTRERRCVKGVTVPILYYGSPLGPERVWWSRDCRYVYLLHRSRGYLAYSLVVIDVATGESRVLVEEHAATGIDPQLLYGRGPLVRVFDGGKSILWFSQRDGWGHLYLYDGVTGEFRRQLTSGAWSVSDVLHIDESGRWIYFTAMGRESGRDPYYDHVYRISLDGGEPELLTPEDATHQAIFAPGGSCFIDSYSRLDLPPVTVLRAADGAVICELERAEIDRLLEMGWTPPERFCAKARDGVTDIYGVLFRPSRFRPESGVKLPILDDIYAGPQANRAPVSFAGYGLPGAVPDQSVGFWQAQALAELGFAVVMIDGLGMPGRSKAFHDRSYRNLGDGGIVDHIAAIRQLADRYPYLDLERVGVYGHSAGGYASAHAILAFPEFYKVAVSSAGNHDHRLDKASWVERYMGLPVGCHYHEQANASLAHRLQGKLLLIHGEMDENVHISSTLRLVDALIKANKDFDLLILPNRPHACTTDPYFIRKRWDYFVRHLLGMEPPSGYEIKSPPT